MDASDDEYFAAPGCRSTAAFITCLPWITITGMKTVLAIPPNLLS